MHAKAKCCRQFEQQRGGSVRTNKLPRKHILAPDEFHNAFRLHQEERHKEEQPTEDLEEQPTCTQETVADNNPMMEEQGSEQLHSGQPALLMERSWRLGPPYLEQESKARDIGRVQLLPELECSLHGRRNLERKDSHSPVRGSRGRA